MNFRSLVKNLASIKLAVVIILSLAGIIAWGTLVEAHYDDSVAAQKIVYHSIWMYSTMSALAICLIAVMIDRWPWQKKHTGFILAHIGIITLMIGSIVTAVWGVDGSMNLGIGEKSNEIATNQVNLAVYTSMDGERFTKIFDHDIDFYMHRPNTGSPFEVALPNGTMKVIDYLPYALRDEKIVASEEPNAGAGVRFQLQNDRVNLTDWLLQPGAGKQVVKDLGPAQVILAGDGAVGAMTGAKTGAETDVKGTAGAALDAELRGRNSIVLRLPKKAGDRLEYEIHSARGPASVRRGTLTPGDSIVTGWMGLILRVLKFLPHAREQVTYKPLDKATPVTNAAIKIQYNGRERWMGLNSTLKLFSDEAVFVVAFGNRRLDLGFPISLKSFTVGRYQGTMRAASYQSVVSVPGIAKHLISMNEPLKYRGYTFYQASFTDDEQGHPVASILSVNWDPGRWIKYLGSLLIVLGTIHLFYFKRFGTRAKVPDAA